MLAACATDATDPRPETAAYVIEAILVPSCGRGGCHSTETKAHDLAFDTIDGSLAAMKSRQRGGRTLVVPGDETSEMITILTDPDEPMPQDAPLPDPDITLITSWIVDADAAGLE